MRNKFICPNCYKKVKCQDVQFRCSETSCTAKAVDERYQRYLLSITNDKKEADIQQDWLMGNVFSGKKGFLEKTHLAGGTMPYEAFCPECGTNSKIRVCPECHCELPDNFDLVETLVFGVFGVRGVSKSTYIATLVWELINEGGLSKIINNSEASFTFAMNDVEIRYMKYYHDPLYEKKNTIGGTQIRANRDTQDLDFKKPLTFKWSIGDKTTNIVIFDIAGEDCTSSELLNSAAKYLPYVDGLICIIDPLYLRSFRTQVDPEIVKACSTCTDEEALKYVPETLFHNICSIINPGRKVDIPMSIALSKSDLIQMENGFPLGGRAQDRNSEIIVNRKFNMAECEAVSNEVRYFLAEHGAGNAISFINNNFTNYSYSTFSALGCQPKEVEEGNSYNGKVAQPHPIRIADSLLFLLHENNII